MISKLPGSDVLDFLCIDWLKDVYERGTIRIFEKKVKKQDIPAS
jgi:hypothetical protein